jgi:hypothetical protein
VQKWRYYLSNCFWLLIPPIVWNVVFFSDLPFRYQPDFFWKDIPIWIATGEHGLRLLVFALPIFMEIRIEDQKQKTGLFLYCTGLALYFGSWILQIRFPESSYSESLFGFAAPGFTPIIWLIGIGMIGRQLTIRLPFHRWLYASLSIGFVAFHVTHIIYIYYR